MPDSPSDDTTQTAGAPSGEGENTPAVDTNQDVNQAGSAESSAAEEKGEKPERSMLDAVRDALEPADKGGESSAPDAEGQGEAESGEGTEGEGEADAESDDLGEVTDEELSRYHSKTRRRIKKLLDERNTARDQATELEPKAQRFDQMVQYVNNAGLTADEVNQGFGIMASLVKARTDPDAAQQALEALAPIVNHLQQATGQALPQDLQQAVQQGYISREHATEMARLRSSSEMARAAATQASENVQRSQAEHQQQTMQEVARSVSDWEQKWSESDPDYQAKQPRVMEKIKLALYEAQQSGQYPRTVKDALDLAEKAKREVEQEIGKFRQQRKEIKPVTSSGSAPTASPKPQTMLDVVKQAAAGG